MYIDHTLAAFLDELASREPVPGGGSAAALAGATAAGLVSMVCNLTIGKRRYRDAETVLTEVLAQSEERRHRLMMLVDEDTRAYARVMAAYRLPRNTAADQAERERTWQAALEQAAAVPMDVAEACLGVLSLAESAAKLGNPWAVSDAGAAALLAEAAAEAAGLSVEVNLVSISDASLAAQYRERMAASKQACAELRERVLQVAQQRMHG